MEVPGPEEEDGDGEEKAKGVARNRALEVEEIFLLFRFELTVGLILLFLNNSRLRFR